MPAFLQVADTYLLGDFFGGHQETREQVVFDYLEYFKNRIRGLTDQEIFIIFDLSDQNIGGFFMTESKKGLIKTQYGATDKLTGLGVNQDSIYEQVKGKRTDFHIDRDWLLSADSVLQGLDWSINKIKNCPQNGM